MNQTIEYRDIHGNRNYKDSLFRMVFKKKCDLLELYNAINGTEYRDPENRQIMIVASEVEDTGYCEWPRVQEIVEFAKRMGYQKLGIATCVGLIRESRMLARVLRSHGFEVYGIACKAGKDAVGIQATRPSAGCNMCNPILQAKMLEWGFSQLRDRTQVSHTAGRFFTS